MAEWSTPRRPCPSCTRRWRPARAEGPDHADPDGAAGRGGRRTRAGGRHQGASPTRGGPWSSPTPRTPSPTSGPRGPTCWRPSRWRRPSWSGSAGCFPSPRKLQIGRSSGIVAPHEHPRRTALLAEHEWVRVEGTRVPSGSPTTHRTRSGDIVFVDLPAVERGRGRRATRRAGVHQIGVGDLRTGRRHGHRRERALAEGPERINQDPYGEGWICEIEALGGRGSGQPARRRRLR